MCGSSMTPLVPTKTEPWPGNFCGAIRACTSRLGRWLPSYQVTRTLSPSVNRVPGKT